jgi:hypothetical protein
MVWWSLNAAQVLCKHVLIYILQVSPWRVGISSCVSEWMVLISTSARNLLTGFAPRASCFLREPLATGRGSSACGTPILLFRPLGRGTFSCLPKRKYPKRKAPDGLSGPESAILARIPCASRENRRSRNSRSRCARLRSNRARACSGFPCDARLRQTGYGAVPLISSSLQIPLDPGIRRDDQK